MFATQVASYYCYIFLLVQYLLHKWQPVTAIYSSQCSIYYTSGSLLLLYIPPSALFPVIPLCPILSPTAPNKACEQPLLSVQKYKPFSILPCMTPARFHLQSKAFRVLSKFQGHKLTYIPLLYSRETIVK